MKKYHIQLNKGKVALVQYLEKHRAILQEKTDNHTNTLFPVKGDRFYISHTICKEIRKLNHKLTNIKQIRASIGFHIIIYERCNTWLGIVIFLLQNTMFKKIWNRYRRLLRVYIR